MPAHSPGERRRGSSHGGCPSSSGWGRGLRAWLAKAAPRGDTCQLPLVAPARRPRHTMSCSAPL
eukprot:14766849-Alexandrium_andersonii.AAC.1